MDTSVITGNEEFKRIVEKVRTECRQKAFSDIVDDNGYQYVDLVMEGGGMLGIALVGYTYVLEQAGIRFLGIGGTSAGSINALLLAALGKPEEAKGDKLLAELFNKNFYEFIDGDADARDLINCWIKGAGKFKLAFKAAQVMDNIQDDLGLNPGNTFVRWIEDLLDREGIQTWAQLRTRMETLPGGLPGHVKSHLAIIAADVSTETKVEFPKMACLYWDDPDNVNPALFVRASMSIPYFFHPFRIKGLPQGQAARQNWEEYTGFIADDEGGVPVDALFIDGGIMSNFPIDVFHDPDHVPAAPTFGVKLQLDKRRKKISSPLAMFGAMFNSARHTLDYDFIYKNPDYRKLVTWIPARGYNWLDFNMSAEDKAGLFLEGARCAADFLMGFDWQDYKKIRKCIAGS